MTEHKQVIEKISELQELILIEMENSKKQGEKLDKYSSRLKFWSLFASGVITVLLGWSFLGDYGKNAAIFVSAILTLINAWEVFKSYTPHAQQEKHIHRQLSYLYGETILYVAGNEDCKLNDYDVYKAKYDVITEEYVEERKKIDDESKSNEINKNLP